MKLDWVGRSLADIDSINAYIRSNNPTAAARVFTAIKSTADRLRRFPRSGPPGRQPGTPYLIVYCLGSDAIVILRVLHGRQAWPDTDP